MLSPRSRRWRRAVITVLSATVLAGSALALPTTPAQADEVATAQHRVDALQSLARETTAKLTEGTRRWEADQRALKRVQLRLANTRARITRTQAEVDAQQAHVDAIVRGVYMRPNGAALNAAISGGPDDVLEVLQAQQGLNVAAGSQSQVIARALTVKHRLRTEEASAEKLVDDAAALTRSSAKRLAELNKLAETTAAQLDAAQSALDQALTRRAAARAKAARLRAEALARARAARSRAVVVSVPSGAFCTGKATTGQANGNLDPSSLCPLWKAPGHRLRADAAKAFNAMSQYHAKTAGSPLCVTDSYRSYSEQVSVYRRKPGLAAVPGSSNHGWGLAVDFCGGVQTFGSSAYQWMKANAGRFGWHHPEWAEPSGSKPEAWHWEYAG